MTPKSDKMITEHFQLFVNMVEKRLNDGRKQYGDTSFEKPLDSVVDEIQQELEDVCGWAVIMWSRLEQIKTKL